MAIKKSELYSSLWSSCDELRGGMDAGQYKDYVLVLLFIKYVTLMNLEAAAAAQLLLRTREQSCHPGKTPRSRFRPEVSG